MLHSLLITNYRAAADLLSHLIRESGEISLDQAFCPSPTPYQLSRALNTLALDVVFLDTTDADQAASVCEEIRKKASKTAIVGFSAERAEQELSAIPTLGWPFSVARLRQIVREAVRRAPASSFQNVFCVLPVKGGSGATTLTLNTACHLAASFRKNVLVAEADLRSGTLAHRLGARSAQSMAQSLACADSCVSLIWPRHVARKFGADWMLAGGERSSSSPLWCDFHHLLAFTSSRYQYTLVDLPELLDDCAAEVALRSQTVLLVMTADALATHLAQERVDELETLGVPKTRIKILVNQVRSSSGDPTADLKRALGCDVAGVFPYDFAAVERSTREQRFLDAGTKLGRAYRTLAGRLAGDREPSAGREAQPSLLGFLSSFRRSTVRA